MFRIAQLKEILHSLQRARAIAEQQLLTDIAGQIHESITQVCAELDRAIQTQPANTGTTPKTTGKTTKNKEPSE